MINSTVRWLFSDDHGGFPVAISQSVHPIDQMSAFLPWPVSAITSGAIQFAVPEWNAHHGSLQKPIVIWLRTAHGSEDLSHRMRVLVLLQSFGTAEIDQLDVSIDIEHDILPLDISEIRRQRCSAKEKFPRYVELTDARPHSHAGRRHLRLFVECTSSVYHCGMDRTRPVSSRSSRLVSTPKWNTDERGPWKRDCAIYHEDSH